MLPIIGPEIIQEFITKLERDGKSKDYVDGMLEGMSFVLEFYLGVAKLSAIKDRLMKEEYSVSTQISA